jgi:hypothetical protein
MTKNQEAHLQRVKDSFCQAADIKYRKGAAEHGGDLLDAPAATILDFAIEEAIDQVIYLLSLKEKTGADRDGRSQSADCRVSVARERLNDFARCSEIGTPTT